MKTVKEFTGQQRALGRYSFTWNRLRESFNQSDKALKQALFRLKKKGKIASVKSGFYVIIAPEFSKAGMLPANLFIHELMQHLNKSYYVGMFSAAALQGASHQAIMNYYVVTDHPPVRSIKNKKMTLNFFTKKNGQANSFFNEKQMRVI